MKRLGLAILIVGTIASIVFAIAWILNAEIAKACLSAGGKSGYTWDGKPTCEK